MQQKKGAPYCQKRLNSSRLENDVVAGFTCYMFQRKHVLTSTIPADMGKRRSSQGEGIGETGKLEEISSFGKCYLVFFQIPVFAWSEVKWNPVWCPAAVACWPFSCLVNSEMQFCSPEL